jgi:hypothetical protein
MLRLHRQCGNSVDLGAATLEVWIAAWARGKDQRYAVKVHADSL